jgi:hypothetical protein
MAGYFYIFQFHCIAHKIFTNETVMYNTDNVKMHLCSRIHKETLRGK